MRARRASVEIMFEGVDITTSIRPYLTSMTYTDSEEDESDSLQIELQDREGLWLESWLNRATLATAASHFAMSAVILPESWSGGGGTVAYISTRDMGTSGGGAGTSHRAGESVNFSNVPFYYTSTAEKPSVYKSGTFYYYDGILINGRYRMTNLPERCGKLPVGVNVTGWVKAEDCGGGAAAASGGTQMVSVGGDVCGILPTGRFELDSVEANGPPSTVSIKGSSLPYGSAIRQTKKTKAWENYSLSGIAKEIAKNAGLECLYEAEKDPTYERKEQTKKSDITFLSELCHDEGISLKCSDGKLVLFDQSVYEALPPVMVIVRGGGAYEDYSLSTGAAETQYGSCRVSYTDPATGKCFEGIATAEGEDGESEQRLEITARVASDGEAQALAEMNLRLHNKFNRFASFTLPGNTNLVAGVTVLLVGFGGWDGKYMVKQATHTVGGGYTTKIDLRKVLIRSSGNSGGEKKNSGAEKTDSGGGTYTVKPGDNLWNIAKEKYGSGAAYTKIYEANKNLIGGNPNLIFPGQKLTIP